MDSKLEDLCSFHLFDLILTMYISYRTCNKNPFLGEALLFKLPLPQFNILFKVVSEDKLGRGLICLRSQKWSYSTYCISKGKVDPFQMRTVFMFFTLFLDPYYKTFILTCLHKFPIIQHKDIILIHKSASVSA